MDETMGEQVAQVLRSEGFNARYAGDVGLIGRSDEDVFAEAWRDNRKRFSSAATKSITFDEDAGPV